MNNVKISKEISLKYPALRIGCIHLVEGNNAREVSTELVDFQRYAEELIRSNFENVEKLNESLFIQVWKQIYRDNGTKPSKYRPTVEALCRRALKNQKLPIINNIVNSYIVGSLKSLMPYGGYDAEKVEGDIHLRFSEGGEIFEGIDGTKFETFAGEVVYADAKDILTSRWNYRDSAKAMITRTTKNVILLTEAPVESIEDEHLQFAVDHVKTLLNRFVGGNVSSAIVEIS